MFGFGKKKVSVRRTREGSHGDHWSAVYGFDAGSHLEQAIYGLADELTEVEQLGRGRALLCKEADPLAVYGVRTGARLTTMYPALRAEDSLPVTIKEIIEWSHVGGVEGQVQGGGRDTFGLTFFATDFPSRRKAYLEGGSQPVALSGLAYVVKPLEQLPEGFAPEFCSYLPSQDAASGDVYDFIGDVLSAERLELLGETFELLRVRLINDPDNPQMFELPLLINVKNAPEGLVPVGGKATGCFWLQGRLGG